MNNLMMYCLLTKCVEGMQVDENFTVFMGVCIVVITLIFCIVYPILRLVRYLGARR